MKKLKSVILAVIAAVCLTFAFAACNSGEGNGNGGQADNSVVGKTYVFKEATGTAPGNFVEEYNERNAGATFTFNEDGTIINENPVQQMQSYYTYEQEGTEVTLTPVKIVIGGNEIDNSYAAQVVMTVEGNKLISDFKAVGEGGEPIDMVLVYELKTN